MSNHNPHKFLYGLPMVIVILALVLAWSSQQPVYGQADGVLPRVINTQPMRGDELPIQQGVTFTFNTPMNRESVEAAFHVSPAAPGFFQWQDESTFTYSPIKPFDRATAYIFQFDTGARSLEEVLLHDAFSLKLYTTGFLSVTQFLPQDEYGVSVGETITIVFNRPVVPLGTAEQMKTMPPPFKSDPVIVGSGEWLTTSIYHFIPTNPLHGNTQYTVTIPASLTDVSGSSPKEDLTFQFKTLAGNSPKPQSFGIRYFTPDKGKNGVFRRPVIQVGFDAPADTVSAEAGFTLTTPDGRVIPGKFEWKGQHYELRFRPDELLDYNTTYTAKMNRKGVLSKTGQPLATDADTYFTTLGLPQIVSTSPHDGSLVDPSATVSIYFSAPMKLDDLARRVEISPKTPNVVLDADISPDSTYARIQFSTLPSTIYTVTLDTKGLVDLWGTPVQIMPQEKVYKIVGEHKVQFRYVTSALGAAVSLETAGQQMGLYNAYHQTRVFVTHRNIGTVGLTLFHLTLPMFLNASNNAYRAPDEQETLTRRWVVPVYNPKNIMRYDLLSITTDGTSIGQEGNVVCVEAAPSNLAVGQKVRVVRREIPEDDKSTPTAPAPINIRNEPGLQNTVVIFRADHGTDFLVLDGPVCADRYAWWKVQSDDGSLNGWIAEGDLKQPYVVPLTEEGETSTPVPSTEAGAAVNTPYEGLTPGVYRLELEAPEISDESHHLTHIMLIATDNITLKIAQHEALAWVTDLKSGKPAPGLSVQFYRLMQLDNRQKVLPYGKPILTDQDGIAHLEVSEELYPTREVVYAAVVSEGHFALTASTWVQGIDAYDFQQPDMFYSQDMALYLYTDRRLYRQGDTVYFKGTIRNREDAVYSLSDKTLIPVDIIDPFNQVIYSKKLPVNTFGSFSDSFTVDSGGQLGEYRIIARPNKPDPEPSVTPTPTQVMPTMPTPTSTPFPKVQADLQPDDPQFETVITVADYTPPEFRVAVKPQRSHVSPGDTIRVAVDSSYYFGGAVSKAAVQWYVRTDPYYFYYTGSGSYSFEDYNQDNIAQDYEDDRPREFSSGTGRTDEHGRYLIEIPAALGKSRRSLIYTLEAVIWDESHQMVADRAQVVVDQGQFQVGVGVDNFVGIVNEKQLVRLITVNHDSSPLPNTNVQVRVMRRVWGSVQTIEPGTGRTVWENDVIEKEVTSGPVRTDASGSGKFSFTPLKGGAYKVYVSARDAQGNLIKASTFVWIAGPEFVSWRAPNSNRIDLQADKSRYHVGETATILIPTPFQGESLALVTVERGGILKQEVVKLHGNSTIFHLAITPDMAPNAYLSVTVIKGEDEHNYTAAFRMGLIQLQVDTERLKLNVSIKSDREKLGPREQATYRIHVSNYKGEPVQAEVGLALVDEAILSLMPDNLPSLMSYFYYRQGLGVRTANALIFNVDQTTQEIINIHKGGGKGGDDYFGIFTIRKDFIGTPLWNPFVVTDANGDATITVTLPDQLTTWILDARAYTLPTGDTHTTLVGQSTHSLISTKPLLIRPEMPHFFVKGDSSMLGAIVNNNTDSAQPVAVSLEISGAAVQGDLIQYATIPANGRLKFEWFMIALDSEAIDMTFKVVSKDGRFADATKPVTGRGDERLIPVLRYETPDTVTTGGVIGNEGGSRIEGVVVPSRTKVGEGGSPSGILNLRIERSLASGMTNALKALKTLPHYCIEQTISRFLPDVVMFQAQKQLGYDDPVLFEELSNNVEAALQRLYSDQHVDGGWGWFVNDASDQLISAYALLGLFEAKAAGWAVDPEVIRKALEQLTTTAVNEDTPWWELNRQAFLHYMLARARQIIGRTENKELAFDMGSAITLFDQRDRMNLDAQAFLAMAFRIVTPYAHHSVTLVEGIKRAAKRSLTGVYWEDTNADAWNWTTNTRTTAIILKALIEIEPTSPLLADTVRWLMNARRFDRWETTQETTWSVMALSAWMWLARDLTPEYRFSIALNEQPLLSDEPATQNNARTPYDLSVPLSSLSDNQTNRIGIKRSAGAGTLYYSTTLKTYLPVEEVKALSRGLIIERTYSREEDPEHTPITTAQVGERIRVSLTIIVPETLNYVVIEDPIPAGTQSINTSLQTTPKLEPREPLRYGWGYWAFTHTELRDDRTVLYAPYLPKGTYQFIYQIRAGAVGTYHVLPANGHAFYMPEVFGRTSGGIFMVIPEDRTF